MRKTKGFTLIELLVVIAIIALLISILVPSIARAKELAKRMKCSANIRGMAQAMTTYAASNRDQYPNFDNKVGLVANHAYSKDLTAFWTDANSGKVFNPTDHLLILISNKFFGYDLTICPSGDTGSPSARTIGTDDIGFLSSSGGTSTVYCDYAVHFGWSDGTNKSAASIGDQLDSSVAIMGDKQGTTGGQPVALSVDMNSTSPAFSTQGWNHKADGINLGYYDNHVQFNPASMRAGQQVKNIVYTTDINASDVQADAWGTQTVPVSKYDTVLISGKAS